MGRTRGAQCEAVHGACGAGAGGGGGAGAPHTPTLRPQRGPALLPVSVRAQERGAGIGVWRPARGCLLAVRPHTDWQSGQYRVRPVRVTRQLEDGDSVEGLEVIHLPGHSPGSLAFLDRERSWLFTGDTLYGGGGLIDWLPSSAPSQYLVSMDHLVKLLQEIPSLTVFPGHGPELSSGGAMAVAMEYCASAGPCHTLRVTALSWLVNIALHARHR